MTVARRRLLRILSYVFGATVIPMRNRFAAAAQNPAQPASPATPANASPKHESKGNASMSQQGRVIGIGGIFFKSANKPQMLEWYSKNLGMADSGHGVMLPWCEKDHPENEHVTVWSVFPATTKYFEPSQSSFMLNYIVDDMDALLARMEKEGVRIDPKRQDESYGRFAWVYDPDGNKIELWQPVHEKK
jgi:catechol 2,3-dioxygenase-like lactoylglutathione lyase family enzyme